MATPGGIPSPAAVESAAPLPDGKGRAAATGTIPVHLLGYLAQLPLARDVGELLQITLSQALRLTSAQAGVALAAGAGQQADAGLSEGPVDPAVRRAAQRLLPGLTSDGEPAPARAPDPPIWTADVHADQGGMLSVGFAALPGDGQLQGLLALVLPPGRTIAPPIRDVLGLMITAAGGMLATRRTLNSTHQRLAEMGLLYEVATTMGSTIDLAALLTAIVRLTQATLRSEACTLMLLNEERTELVFEIPVGEKEGELTQYRIGLDEGLAGWVARTGRPAVVNDIRNDPRFNAAVDAATQFTTRAALCVPLQVRGQVIGVIEVLNKVDATPYTPHDLALLTTLSGQAAIAIDNARLYHRLREEHERLLAAAEEVRHTLARELHDGPAQDLAAISMGLEISRRLLDTDVARAQAELESLEAVARHAMRQIRTLQFELRPVVLETRGLRAALEAYVHQLSEGGGLPQYTFTAAGCQERLPPPIERAAFSIVQEALTNARKHALASHVQVTMQQRTGAWVIQISDDGQGFDVNTVLQGDEARNSLGLLSMRERAVDIGGQLILQAAPNRGTAVALRIPVAPARSAEPSAAP